MMDPELIERFAAGGPILAAEIAGLGREQLLARPVPGTWSIQEIVVHLMDSDVIGSYRMKRIAAMDEPRLDAYDETLFARRLGYDAVDATLAAEVFRLNRAATAAMLRSLPAEAFERAGMHEERGRITLRELVGIHADHLEHHLRHLRQKREMVAAAR